MQGIGGERERVHVYVNQELRDELAAQPLSSCLVFALKFQDIVSPHVCEVAAFSLSIIMLAV